MTTTTAIPMNAVQARICLSPALYALWQDDYRRRIALGSSVRDAERFAGQAVRDSRCEVSQAEDRGSDIFAESKEALDG